MADLKSKSRPAHNVDYKHSYDPKDFGQVPVEVTSLCGPIYSVDTRHSYGHDYKAPDDEKKLHHPVYMDGRHSYGHDYKAKSEEKRLHGPVYQDSRHSYGHEPRKPEPAKQSAFPVMNAPHSHQVCRKNMCV